MSSAPQGYTAARRYTVARSLAELTGPTSGRITLPTRLDWGPSRLYDLANERDVVIMYERVIRESQSVDDLNSHLHAPTLQRLWPRLVLPPHARQAWEKRFPELRTAIAA